ncbi:SEFIR domain-containing protein, partial [Chromobacterium subtsugae]|uniref:SEFIR domain-containing protein n=2 Tax=Chromobacterium subtsugae TaxID=251747 RepID=UPI0039B4876F
MGLVGALHSLRSFRHRLPLALDFSNLYGCSAMTTSPKVFISYSHDSDEHKEWVYKIACKLIESGVETLWSVPL